MPDTVSTPGDAAPAKWPVAAGVAGLLLLHFVLANGANWNKGATFDENAHIGNGFSFWATGDFRMAPEAILPQRWMALPVYLAGFQAPATDNQAWYVAEVWIYTRELLYREGSDGQTILRISRAANSLWSVALAWVTFAWARSLFGTASGFVALMLYVFSPLALANAALATTDIATAFAFTASTFALWRLLEVVSPLRLAASTLLVGAAFATKSSAVLLIFIGLGMGVVRVASLRPLPVRFFHVRREITSLLWQAALIAGLVIVHILVAWVLLWGLFNFRYEKFVNYDPQRDKPFTGDWEQVMAAMTAPRPPSTEERNKTVASVIQFFRDYRLLPEAYLYVNANAVNTTSARSAFLNGRYGIYGFVSFFPYCFLYKTPVAVFLLFLAASAAHVARRIYQIGALRQPALKCFWEGLYATTPLWSLLGVYWFFSLTSAINIGARHILPTFPATFILASVAAWWLVPTAQGFAFGIANGAKSSGPPIAKHSEPAKPFPLPHLHKAMRIAVCGALVWLTATVLWASHYGYIAYFNIIAGGPANGFKHLVDSSLDWGQELPNLKRWLDKEIRSQPNPPRVYVSLFGSTPPGAVELRDVTWLPSYFSIEQLEPVPPVQLELMTTNPGVYCISNTNLQCVYNTINLPTGGGVSMSGPWRTDFEQNYQVLAQNMQRFVQSHGNQIQREAATAALKQTTGLTDWTIAYRIFEIARFGRLCAYLRRREPVATINYAISIYRVSIDDLRQALMGSPPVETYPKPEKPDDNVPY